MRAADARLEDVHLSPVYVVWKCRRSACRQKYVARLPASAASGPAEQRQTLRLVVLEARKARPDLT